jgi:carbamoyltransferase
MVNRQRAHPMTMTVIGLSAFYHDSACCVIQDGVLRCAVEEERFSRSKYDPRLPWQAFRYCLSECRLGLSDIDCIAYYEDPRKKLARQLWMHLQPGSARLDHGRLRRILDVQRVEREIREVLGFEGRLEFVDHHLSHAASSYYFSGFSDAAVLTVDGVGEWATTTAGRASGDDLELIEEVEFPNSLGLLYAAITSYLGFEINSGEYKVMGLAPYGKPRYVDRLNQLIESSDGLQYQLDMSYFDFAAGDRMCSARLIELLGRPAREPDAEIDQFHQDIAHSLQVVLESVLLKKVSWLHQRVPSENLCMAGGVALNCVANSRILREGPFRRLFVQPAAGDAGGALGAAAIAYKRLANRAPKRAALDHVYLGPEYSYEEIRAILDSTSAGAVDYHGRFDELIAAVVDRLVDGRVLGWFQGRMELGPRALGSRSIIADPRRPDMRDRINALVKQREAFRPFAPSVLLDRATEHFDIDHASPFMLETCQVRSSLELPAITHVDGSARIQTVDERVSPRYAALLRAFEVRTGCPIVLNTSFNMKDEPIVCTPVDAIKCFVRANIDTLVLGDFLLDAAKVPPLWRFAVSSMGNPADLIDHNVYTLL